MKISVLALMYVSCRSLNNIENFFFLRETERIASDKSIFIILHFLLILFVERKESQAISR